MDSKRRAGAWLPALAAIAGAIAFAAPASGRAATTDVLGGCPASAYDQPFLRWLDLDSYFLAPNGGLEAGAAGWTLGGGAGVVSGNESYQAHGGSDTSSLSLPQGSSATTSSVCVDPVSPTLRLFVRNSGSLLSTLKVEALYTDLLGVRRTTTVALLIGGSTWQPTLPITFLSNLTALPLVTNGATSVSFRFTPQGVLGAWRIDDVYVDPFKGE